MFCICIKFELSFVQKYDWKCCKQNAEILFPSRIGDFLIGENYKKHSWSNVRNVKSEKTRQFRYVT